MLVGLPILLMHYLFIKLKKKIFAYLFYLLILISKKKTERTLCTLCINSKCIVSVCFMEIYRLFLI